MKHNHSTFLFLSILVTVFVASIYVYMFLMIDYSLKKTVEAQSIANSAALIKSREKSFMETYEKTASKWSNLQNFFVGSNKVVEFIEAVELISNQSGSKVSIASIDADDLEKAPPGKEGALRLRVNTQGNWSSVMRALMLAEVLPYKITINNVQANVQNESTTANSKSSEKIWSLNFDLQVAMIAASSTSTGIK